MESIITKCILDNAQKLFGQTIPETLIQFQKTRKDVDGDLTLVTFPYTKFLKSSPEETGEKIGIFLKDEIKEISGFNVIKGFLNIILSDDFWIKALKKANADEQFGFVNKDSGRTYMVEYSSPNTNKPLHLGHLRNNFLGYSVAEVLKANGHKVIKTQIINDRGIHICKSMIAWERFAPTDEKGNRETPQSTGMKGDHFVGKYYIEFDKQMTIETFQIAEKSMSNGFTDFNEEESATLTKLFEIYGNENDEKKKSSIQRKIAGIAKDHSNLLRDAQEMLVKWEAKDPQVYLLWSTMNGWVYKGFEATYKRMGVDFDKLYYESDTYLIGKDYILKGLEQGVFYKKEDDSVWVDLTDEGLDEKLLLRGDGTAVYMTQDIGTAIDRFEDYSDLNGIVYTVGNEQDYHFQVLFLILKKLGYSWAEHCYHLSYGMVDLPDGKMKSREGKVVDADDLMEEVVNRAKESTQERGHLEGMSDKERGKLYELIGLGGLKYYLLKVDPQKRMKFNPEESIELNGNTGPFIQYAHARIQSLLSKADGFLFSESLKIGVEEKAIVKQLSLFPEVVKEAGENFSPALIANYSFELVKQYNSFYQSVSILNEDDDELKTARIIISKNVAKVVRLAMNLLGINVPNRM